MSRFSERVGAAEPPRRIQIGEMDEALRASLWNVLVPRFKGTAYGGKWLDAARFLAHNLFKVPTDSINGYDEAAYAWVRNHFFSQEWHVVYDMVEMLAQNVDQICRPTGHGIYYRDQRASLISELNDVLRRELSGYRFVKGVLAPISDPAEVAAIEAAASATSGDALAGAHSHITSALRLLGQKPDPDYRNSIKESISAVECVVKVVTGSTGSGVADAIEKLSAHTEIHGALKSALKKLYGFTSDSDGIRHAILDQSTVGYDEAKFMLVTCAAFVNFLTGKAVQAGLL